MPRPIGSGSGRPRGWTIDAIVCDITDEDQVTRAVEALASRREPRVLVANGRKRVIPERSCRWVRGVGLLLSRLNVTGNRAVHQVKAGSRHE